MLRLFATLRFRTSGIHLITRMTMPNVPLLLPSYNLLSIFGPRSLSFIAFSKNNSSVTALCFRECSNFSSFYLHTCAKIGFSSLESVLGVKSRLTFPVLWLKGESTLSSHTLVSLVHTHDFTAGVFSSALAKPKLVLEFIWGKLNLPLCVVARCWFSVGCLSSYQLNFSCRFLINNNSSPLPYPLKLL